MFVFEKAISSFNKYQYASESYDNITEEEEKKKEYGRGWYKHLSKNEKQKLVEDRRN